MLDCDIDVQVAQSTTRTGSRCERAPTPRATGPTGSPRCCFSHRTMRCSASTPRRRRRRSTRRQSETSCYVGDCASGPERTRSPERHGFALLALPESVVVNKRPRQDTGPAMHHLVRVPSQVDANGNSRQPSQRDREMDDRPF